MKTRYLCIWALVLALAAFCWSCVPEEVVPDKEYDVTLLYGTWLLNDSQLYYQYSEDGTGKTWDASDDISEEEAQSFTWTLEKSEMIHMHILSTGTALVPKYYVVTKLTSDELCYYDAYVTSKTYQFIRVIP